MTRSCLIFLVEMAIPAFCFLERTSPPISMPLPSSLFCLIIFMWMERSVQTGTTGAWEPMPLTTWRKPGPPIMEGVAETTMLRAPKKRPTTKAVLFGTWRKGMGSATERMESLPMITRPISRCWKDISVPILPAGMKPCAIPQDSTNGGGSLTHCWPKRPCRN